MNKSIIVVAICISLIVPLAAISVVSVSADFGTSASGTITALIVSKSSNLRANLSDGNVVILNWSGTAGGTYGIYITNDFLAGFPSPANPDATNTTLLWTDTEASDYKQRYYRIGICADINEDETGAKYEISMKNGWNLISTPINLTNKSIDAAWATIEGNYDDAYAWNATVQGWESIVGRDGVKGNMTTELGYWVHMTADDKLVLVGNVSNKTGITIVDGWTIVGYPSVYPRDLDTLLTGFPTNYEVFAWNATVQGWECGVGRNPPLTQFATGRGYWIKSPAAREYEVKFGGD